MKLEMLLDELEKFCPLGYAEKWDNCGLQAGRFDKEVKKVYIALDATGEVIEKAGEAGADLILTHHPLLFDGIKHVTDRDFTGKRILEIIRKDMALYAMHTNFDVAAMADAAADMLSLRDQTILEVTGEDEKGPHGIGKVGRAESPMTLFETAEAVKKAFRIPRVRFYGDPYARIRVIAILPGSGKSEIDLALRSGADVMITGDINHHAGIDAVEKGIAVIDAGHYGVEKLFVPYMADFLKERFPGLEIFLQEEKEYFTEV
ncbi:MAG: Nif3-like dinuclear metal center hexameric protein [Lachnospiraceae bacterium]|nr:Nif3-like dinuclear metal center hexameric protein [Lachnospiraceae bacterium]